MVTLETKKRSRLTARWELGGKSFDDKTSDVYNALKSNSGPVAQQDRAAVS